MPLQRTIFVALVLMTTPIAALCDVTDLPAGAYGGTFRDESTGKVWLDVDVIRGGQDQKLSSLAATPFRLATTAEILSLMQPEIIQDAAIGGYMPCPNPPHGIECKYGVFDDALTGTVPELPGVAGMQLGATSVTIENDRTDNTGSATVGTWAIQRAPALRPSDPYSLDFDGDSKDDKVVWRRATGEYFVRFSASNEVLSVQWGFPSDIPIVGDYDGDRIPDLAVFRPSTSYWYILSSIALYDRARPLALQFGLPGDTPIRVDNDGDGRLDVTVWRNGDGNYYYIKSSNAQFTVEQWGLPGDVPINAVR